MWNCGCHIKNQEVTKILLYLNQNDLYVTSVIHGVVQWMISLRIGRGNGREPPPITPYSNKSMGMIPLTSSIISIKQWKRGAQNQQYILDSFLPFSLDPSKIPLIIIKKVKK